MANNVRLLLQTKIYDTIRNDADISAVVGTRVYDNVPTNPTYPFVTIGDIGSVDFGSHTHSGFECTAIVHVWARVQGRKTVQQVMNDIYNVLHEVDLGITGFATLSCRESASRVLVEEDNETHHGISEYRILLGGN